MSGDGRMVKDLCAELILHATDGTADVFISLAALLMASAAIAGAMGHPAVAVHEALDHALALVEYEKRRRAQEQTQ